MPITKVSRTSEKKATKFFTGGKPKDFELIATSNSARVKGILTPDGKSYKLYAGASGGERAAETYTHQFSAAALREVAEHFAELADILDGKVVAEAA